MGLVEHAKGTRLHEAGSPVKTLEIVLKGQVSMMLGEQVVSLKQGSIVGIAEHPEKPYRFTYVVAADAVVYSYPYGARDDIEKVMYANQKIAASMTSQTVSNALSIYEAYLSMVEEAKALDKKVRQDIKDYPTLCQETGTQAKSFPELDDLGAPPEGDALDHWRVGFLKIFNDYSDKLGGVYALGPAMCVGVVYNAAELIEQVAFLTEDMLLYEEDFRKKTNSFKLAVDSLHAKKESSGDADGGDESVPRHILEHLLQFAEADDELSDTLRKQMKQYRAFPDRSDTSDELRALRRKLTDSFLTLYKKVFFASLNNPDTPIEAKMFLMFGVLDEEVVDDKDLLTVYRYTKAYQPDPNGKVMTVSEWLSLIYQLKVDPSRNEFDLDYPGYLKESRQNGDITAAQEEALLNDREARFDFELKNFFAIGNRMTFGRVTAYVPVFDSCNVLMPMDKAYVSRLRIEEEFARVRSIDFNIFYRDKTFSAPAQGINAMTVHEEVLPYVVLMPNFGARSMLWQEIEGKKRSSPGRMVFPIFITEDLSDSVTRVCGEFRWEMCKTEQGIHWNDLSDPSLTAEYNDYLQYYRKNSALNQEQKDKLKKDLQKYSNNYRRVFVGDYLIYINYEAKAALRLNKVAREIIFRYCPFSGEVRTALGSNPQYAEHINRHNNKMSQKAHPMENIIKKMEHSGETPPRELIDEVAFLSR